MNGVGEADPFLHVAIEADAVRHAESEGLAHVVQQRAESEREGGMGHLLEEEEGVIPDIAFGMELRGLFHALHAGDFREEVGQHAAGIEQFEAAPRSAFGEDSHQFLAHALHRHFEDQRVIAPHGFEGDGVDGEAEPGGEAHSAQQAQVIFAEAGVGVADGAHHSASQVGLALHKIEYASGVGIEHQTVDGEVAAQDIFARIAFEADMFGMAAVQVIVVAAEGGHLHLIEDVAHQHHAEVGPHPAGARKEVHDAIRARVRGNIEVLRLDAEE